MPIETTDKSVTNSYFSDPSKDYIYKADINLYSRKFSGIFIVKKTSPDDHRVVFTTEMGNKIFDFSYRKDDFNIHFILDEIDKKIITNILRKDFLVLIKENVLVQDSFYYKSDTILETEIDKKQHYYFIATDGQLKKIVRTNNGKEKVKFLFTEINDNIAKNIQILHENLQLQIYLKAI